MILLANVMNGLAVVLDMVIGFLILVVIVSVVISWVNADPYNPIVRFLHGVTEPILRPLRRLVPPLGGRLDLSPLLLLLLLYFLRAVLVASLQDYARVVRMGAMGM